ncbi:MAG TPA: type II toxin-antitoxin system MqsA family antitoxin [Thermoanaerobaculia bacterium]|nr:type II toxin-antitoxin system MqsA family antitoxin [Thermoanaerobaculia bacterium]
MKCRICGATQQLTMTDLPFKTGDRSIVILKSLPVFQCAQCSEYSMDDLTFQRVEEILARVDSGAELEIIPFAA